jgi:DNA-binding XRE family transcriptional regulator
MPTQPRNADFYRALAGQRRHHRGWPKGVRRIHRPRTGVTIGPWPKSGLLLLTSCDNVLLVTMTATRDLTGEKIKKLRLRMRLSQTEFAKQLGTTWVTVSRWENGHNCPEPKFRDRIYDLAQVAYAALNEKGRTTAPDFK